VDEEGGLIQTQGWRLNGITGVNFAANGVVRNQICGARNKWSKNVLRLRHFKSLQIAISDGNPYGTKMGGVSTSWLILIQPWKLHLTQRFGVFIAFDQAYSLQIIPASLKIELSTDGSFQNYNITLDPSLLNENCQPRGLNRELFWLALHQVGTRSKVIPCKITAL
jgi:hypothetical protein